MENVKLIKAGSTLAEVFPLGTILSVSAAEALELISTGVCERADDSDDLRSATQLAPRTATRKGVKR